jgi:hypothetical protein
VIETSAQPVEINGKLKILIQKSYLAPEKTIHY